MKAFALIALGLAIGARGFYVAVTHDMPGGAIIWGRPDARRAGARPENRAPPAAGLGFSYHPRRRGPHGAVRWISYVPRRRGRSAALRSATRVIGPAVRSAAALVGGGGADAAARADGRHRAELPGLSVAVGAGGAIVWAEGFGWRDLETRAPVTPSTRFRIGTASTMLTSAAVDALVQQGRLQLDDTLRQSMSRLPNVDDDDALFRHRCERPADALQHGANASTDGWIQVSAAIERAAGQPFLAAMREQVFQPRGMNDTGAESAKEENPDHIGEPEEDFPGFTLVWDILLKPLGIGVTPPSAIDRATFYVPLFDADPRRGVRKMRPRNFSCYAGGLAFLSTPSDLVRLGLASRQPAASRDGELLGASVMSFITRDDGLVVAVMSNAPANMSRTRAASCPDIRATLESRLPAGAARAEDSGVPSPPRFSRSDQGGHRGPQSSRLTEHHVLPGRTRPVPKRL